MACLPIFQVGLTGGNGDSGTPDDLPQGKFVVLFRPMTKPTFALSALMIITQPQSTLETRVKSLETHVTVMDHQSTQVFDSMQAVIQEQSERIESLRKAVVELDGRLKELERVSKGR